jgi:hypothetical protein
LQDDAEVFGQVEGNSARGILCCAKAQFVSKSHCSYYLCSRCIGGDPYQKQITECVALVSAEVSRQLASDETRPPSISAELGLKLAGDFSRGIAALPKKDTVLTLAQRKFQQTGAVDSHSATAGVAAHSQHSAEGKRTFICVSAREFSGAE